MEDSDSTNAHAVAVVAGTTTTTMGPTSLPDNSAENAHQVDVEQALDKDEETATASPVDGIDRDEAEIDPVRWSRTYKWLLVALCSSIEMTTNSAVLICAPAVPQILDQLHATNPSQESSLIVTIWNLGGILGMLAIGPLSETFGRRPIYNGFNVFFTLCALATGFSQNMAMLLAFRFLNGIGIASQALNQSIVADMFEVEQRGRAQAWVGVGPLLGPALGPILGGYLAQTVGWRWTFWLVAIVTGVQALIFALAYRETYLPQLKLKFELRRKRKLERDHREVDDIVKEKVVAVEVAAKSRSSKYRFVKIVTRPARIFVMPVFLIPASCLTLVYGYLYITITTLSEAFQNVYGFSAGASGLAFLGITVGMALGTFVSGFTLDRYVVYMKKRHGGSDGVIQPEWRLPLLIVGGVFVAVGLFLYGWTLQTHVHFIVPIIGTAFVGFSLSATAIPVITYFADVFGDFRASAMSAMSAYRQIVGVLLPLAAPVLFRREGYGWGNSILGFIALAVIPVPFLFLRFGERLRKMSMNADDGSSDLADRLR